MKNMFGEAANKKIHDTNSSLQLKKLTTGKVQFLFFSSFFTDIGKIFILGQRLGTRLYFYEIWIFFSYLLISQDPKS